MQTGRNLPSLSLWLHHTGLHTLTHSKRRWTSEKEWLSEACFFKALFSKQLRNCLLRGTSTLYLH